MDLVGALYSSIPSTIGGEGGTDLEGESQSTLMATSHQNNEEEFFFFSDGHSEVSDSEQVIIQHVIKIIIIIIIIIIINCFQSIDQKKKKLALLHLEVNIEIHLCI